MKITGYALEEAFEDYRRGHCPALTKYTGKEENKRKKEKRMEKRGTCGRSAARGFSNHATADRIDRPTARPAEKYSRDSNGSVRSVRAAKHDDNLLFKKGCSVYSASSAHPSGDREAGITVAKVRSRSPVGTATTVPSTRVHGSFRSPRNRR